MQSFGNDFSVFVTEVLEMKKYMELNFWMDKREVCGI